MAYNALTALNREILKRSWAIETELVENGMTVEQAKAEMKKRRKEDPNLQIISSFTWQKNYLTPEITRHRQAAARIEAGEALEDVWADERYAQPWFHTVPRRTFVSGADQASQALSNWMSSISGHRAGNKVGIVHQEVGVGIVHHYILKDLNHVYLHSSIRHLLHFWSTTMTENCPYCDTPFDPTSMDPCCSQALEEELIVLDEVRKNFIASFH